MGLADRHPAHVDARRQLVPTPIDRLLRLPLELNGQQILPYGVHGRHVVGSLALRILHGGVGPEFLQEDLDALLGLGGVGFQRRAGRAVQGRVAAVVEQFGRTSVLADEGAEDGYRRRPGGGVDGLGAPPDVQDGVGRQRIGRVGQARQCGLLVPAGQRGGEPMLGVVRRRGHRLGGRLGQGGHPLGGPAQHAHGRILIFDHKMCRNQFISLETEHTPRYAASNN